MKKLAIEGIDGAGKTSVTERAVLSFGKMGKKAKAVSIFRAANELLGIDAYELWDTQDFPSAIEAVKSAEQQAIEQADDENIDVLLFDRHWVSGRVFTNGTMAQHEWLTDGLQPIKTILIRVSPHIALARKQEDLHEPWMALQELIKDAAQYEIELEQNKEFRHSIYRSDDTIASIIGCQIAWDDTARR